ncbi:MAG: S-layer homology domain-containing protein [Demequinaceae bacterium]|nr:S-layer homology domain-containing protein [Demequinaceae bacterium]
MSRTWIIRLSALLVVVLAINVVVFFPDDSDTTIAPVPSVTPTFTADEQAALDIAWMIDEGIYVPPTGAEPDPRALVTRSDFAAFLYRLDGNDGGGACVEGVAPFDDVEVERADCTEIAWMAEAEIISPEEADGFRPDDLISRREVAEFLYRYDHPDGGETMCVGDSTFDDVSTTARDCEAVFWATAAWLSPMMPPATETIFVPDSGSTLAVTAHALRTYRDYSPEEIDEFEYQVSEGTREYPAEALLAYERRVLVEARFDSSDQMVSPETLEWSVTLSADYASPEVGDGIFVVPGGTLAPQGVAGRVAEVATDSRGNAVVTIEQVSFDQVFEYYHVDFAQSIDMSDALEIAGAGESVITGGLGGGSLGSVGYDVSAPTAWYSLDCMPFAKQNEEPGVDTSVSGSKIVGTTSMDLDLRFENAKVKFHADLGSIFSNPTIDAYLSWETVFVVTINEKVSAKCTFNVPIHFGIIGPGGFRLDIDPGCAVGVSATVEEKTKLIEARAYSTVGVESVEGGGTRNASSYRSNFWSTRHEIAVSAWISAGLKLQVSWLGVIGIYGKVGLTVEYEYRIEMGAYFEQGCATGGTYVDASLGAFFDIWFYRAEWKWWSWRKPLATYTWLCHPVTDESVNGDRPPEIPLPIPDPTPTTTPTPTPTTTPPPEDPAVILAEQIAEAQASADAAVALADQAARDAAEAQLAADAAANAAGSDPAAAAAAADAQAAADAAAAAAADAQAAADDAVAAAAVAATADEATIAQALADAAAAEAAAADAAALAAQASASAILDAILPYRPLGDVTPVTIAPGEVWSFNYWHVDMWGDPYQVPYWEPVVIPVIPSAIDIAEGFGGAWLLGIDGTVWDLEDILETGSPPNLVPGLPAVSQVVECSDQSYAITPGGDVYGWGYNNGIDEILGNGGASDTWTAVPIPNLHDIVQLDCVWGEKAARASTGEVWVWGENLAGHITGDPSGPVLTPLAIAGIDDAVDIEIGSPDVCVVREDGTVWCWGNTMATHDSDPYDPDWSVVTWQLETVPTKIVRVTDAVDIETGINNWYVRTSTGELWVWGLNFGGSLGEGTDIYRPIPILIDTIDSVERVWAQKDFHHYSVWALKADGTLWGWGQNSSGDLGDGVSGQRFTPIQIPRLSDVVDLVVTPLHIYALDANGDVWMWGLSAQMWIFGYDFGGSPPLRPVQVLHLNGADGIASTGASLYVWAD